MNRLFIALVAVLFASHIYAGEADSCIDEEIAREANYHLEVDPITAKMILDSVPDCDDKFALMHKANVKIAERSRDDFYYQDRIQPNGRSGLQIPNMYEKHVMENPDQFRSGQEGYDRITANDYWIKKIKNRNHPVIADYEFQVLKRYYDGSWEDGDGSRSSVRLVREFSDWTGRHPEHEKVAEARELIERMKHYHAKLIRDYTQWIDEHPGHEKVLDFKKRIEQLQQEIELINNL